MYRWVQMKAPDGLSAGKHTEKRPQRMHSCMAVGARVHDTGASRRCRLQRWHTDWPAVLQGKGALPAA